MYTNVCKHCHKVFKAKIRTLCCKECRSDDEDQLDDIVRYLKEYPNSNALQISEELGIHPYEIIKFMEEGWLTRSTGTLSKLPDDIGGYLPLPKETKGLSRMNPKGDWK